MNRQTIDPVLRAAVRTELERLSDRAHTAPTREWSKTSRQRTRRTFLLTAGSAVVIVGCSLAAIQFGQTRATTAAHEPTAQITAGEVTFEGSPSEAARHERDLKRFLVRSGSGQAGSDRLAVDAVLASPELRYDSSRIESQGLVVVGSAEGGADTEGTPLSGWNRYDEQTGYYGAGAPVASKNARVESLIMNCPGTGTYTWTLRGRTATDSHDRTLARTVGRCGSRLTTIRYRLDEGTRTTSFTVAADNHEGGVYNAAIYRRVLDEG